MPIRTSGGPWMGSQNLGQGGKQEDCDKVFFHGRLSIGWKMVRGEVGLKTDAQKQKPWLRNKGWAGRETRPQRTRFNGESGEAWRRGDKIRDFAEEKLHVTGDFADDRGGFHDRNLNHQWSKQQLEVSRT